MTRLQQAIESLGLEAESALSGQWMKLQGAQCRVHVVEVGWGIYYNTWCEEPGDSSVHVYCDPVEAIQAGLWRAALPNGTVTAQDRPNSLPQQVVPISVPAYSDSFGHA